MITRHVWVEHRPNGRDIAIYWSGIFSPTLIGFNVYQSPQPCSDLSSPSMTKLTNTPVGVPFYLDTTSPLGAPSYLVTEVDSSGERALDRPVQVGDTSDPDRQGRQFPTISMPRVYAEMRRRKELLLGPTTTGEEGIGTGEDVIVLVRRVAGKRCPKCFEGAFEASGKLDCARCWGTGWDRGYERVDNVKMRIKEIEEKILVDPPGMQFKSNPKAWCVNFPLVRNGDVVVRPTEGKRYEIQSVSTVVHQGILTGQDFELVAYDYTLPIYRYPV